MKKFIYISAIISINVITFGGLFKIMHWPGANLLLLVGILFFAFLVLPIAIFNSYQSHKKSLTLYIVGYVCSFIFLISALFKILHWPGAGPLLIIALPLPIILFLPVYYYHQRKLNEDNHTNLIGIMFVLVYYSLFSGLMSLNVSRNVLSTFVKSTSLLNETKIAYEVKNSQFIDTERNENLQKIYEIRNKTSKIKDYIHKLKTELIVSFDKIGYANADTISVENIRNIDNYDIPTYFFLGSNEDEKNGKAYELKQKLEDFKKDLILILPNNKVFHEKINQLINTSDEINLASNQNETWEHNSFYHTIAISAVYKLSFLELNIKIVESVAIQTLIN